MRAAQQLDLLAWAPPAPKPSAHSFLPPLVQAYDLRGRSVAWRKGESLWWQITST